MAQRLTGTQRPALCILTCSFHFVFTLQEYRALLTSWVGKEWKGSDTHTYTYLPPPPAPGRDSGREGPAPHSAQHVPPRQRHPGQLQRVARGVGVLQCRAAGSALGTHPHRWDVSGTGGVGLGNPRLTYGCIGGSVGRRVGDSVTVWHTYPGSFPSQRCGNHKAMAYSRKWLCCTPPPPHPPPPIHTSPASPSFAVALPRSPLLSHWFHNVTKRIVHHPCAGNYSLNVQLPF